jgi:gamma-glutamyltranspeptidase/glutathione hydrolase
METLNILENAKIKEIEYCTAESVHLIAESMKLAWADRLAYDADPRYAEIPRVGLLSKAYARSRFERISLDTAESTVAGNPWQYEQRTTSSTKTSLPIQTERDRNTIHLCVVDKEHNMVSLTHGIYLQVDCGIL